jgi:hypothetical protein
MKAPLLLLLACILIGCKTDETKQGPKPAATTAAPKKIYGTPDNLTPEQIAQLKSRLNQLQAGMSRARVLEILDISSINARSYASANTTGITYHIETGHTLELGLQAGDYDSTLRWARFDGETWPNNYATKATSPETESH